ncbi:MAG: pilin [Candidatus Paceibacterota bacterium]|jgi:hypothetical protein
MKKITHFVTFLVLALMLVMPFVSLAEDPVPEPGLVPCTNTLTDPCDFNALMEMVNKIIDFLLFKMFVPIAAIMFAYAGVIMVTSGGEASGERAKAKKIFTNTVLGLIIAVAAWLIISTILTLFGFNGAWIGLTAEV